MNTKDAGSIDFLL